jgi:hypothetical protein
MTRQNLFGERGAGARQTEYEDGTIGPGTELASSLEERRRETLDEPIDELDVGFPLDNELSFFQQLLAATVRPSQMLGSLSVVFPAIENLRYPEVKRRAPAVR